VVVTGSEWILFSLGQWLLGDCHVAKKAGRVGVRLGELAVEPDGVVSWELGEPALNDFVNLSGNSAGGSRAGHDSLLNTTVEGAERIAMTFVNCTLEGGAVPTHVEITMVHRTGRVTV